ncbi:hypothetical protein SAMN05216559_0793 [Halomicrobium zhouii]|uniref:Uncharacterized protein n=2 Tax=Halomicrobium zhouii TaxID=767519 RepID=A0A1I6KGV1_9EURY|nr:hypothetical protein SAMN05216559_0793 [Halomicrobium zhouii]
MLGIPFDIVYLTFVPGLVTVSVAVTGFLAWYVAVNTPELVTVRQGAIVGALVGFFSHFTNGLLNVVWAVLIQIHLFVELNIEPGADGVALTELMDLDAALTQGLFVTIMGLLFAGVVSTPLAAVAGAGTAWLQDKWL